MNMQSSWYRSRLCWLALAGIFLFLSAWITPLITKEGRYISAQWIAPGDFYQGFGVTLSFHRMWVWVGSPYAGFAYPFRHAGSTNVTFPFERERHSWSEKEAIPILFELGTPSAGSLTVAIDYWLGATVCLGVFYYTLVSRKRRLSPKRISSAD
jgi:hypothetical protein